MPGSVDFGDFVPYELEDLGVIIPHCASMPNRWRWFWPQYKVSVPEIVLKNTVVIYHMDTENAFQVPPEVQAVEDDGCKLEVIKQLGPNLVGSTLRGVEVCETRLIARIHNDIELIHPTWAQKAVEWFNKKPHLKMIGRLVAPGPSYEKARRLCYQPWVDKLLLHGDYDFMSFFVGQFLIANRAVWAAYYPLVARYTQFEREDIYFTLLARADGIKMIFFDIYFRHRGQRGKDIIVAPPRR